MFQLSCLLIHLCSLNSSKALMETDECNSRWKMLTLARKYQYILPSSERQINAPHSPFRCLTLEQKRTKMYAQTSNMFWPQSKPFFEAIGGLWKISDRYDNADMSIWRIDEVSILSDIIAIAIAFLTVFWVFRYNSHLWIILYSAFRLNGIPTDLLLSRLLEGYRILSKTFSSGFMDVPALNFLS